MNTYTYINIKIRKWNLFIKFASVVIELGALLKDRYK